MKAKDDGFENLPPLRETRGRLLAITPTERALRWPEVSARLGGIAKSTIYEMVERGELPPPRRITPKFSGWLETELTDWLRARPVASREDEKLELARSKRKVGSGR